MEGSNLIEGLAERRLANQHLARPDLTTPAEVVKWFGAVQAQDFFGSLFAVGLRMQEANEQLVEAAIADRSIVRTWPMRGTIHFAAAEDVRWILKLVAQRADAQALPVARKAGLTDEHFGAAGAVFEAALEGGKQLNRKELYSALAASGIDPGNSRGLHLLGYWARRGLICWGPRRGKQPTFALLDEWIPPGRDLFGEEALSELAVRYFTSHGPATARDFAWWTGLRVQEATAAAESAGSALQRETIDDRTYWSGPAAATTSRPQPEVYLLPAYDEFTVGYADRSAFVREVKPDGYYDIGYIILIDCRLAGAWKRRLEKDRVVIELSPRRPLTVAEHEALRAAAGRYARFLGLEAEVVMGT